MSIKASPTEIVLINSSDSAIIIGSLESSLLLTISGSLMIYSLASTNFKDLELVDLWSVNFLWYLRILFFIFSFARLNDPYGSLLNAFDFTKIEPSRWILISHLKLKVSLEKRTLEFIKVLKYFFSVACKTSLT